MVEIHDRKYTKEEFRKYFGSMKQVAGISRFTYSEGRAKGLSAAEVRTGSGLRFNILLDRGLDIGLFEYKGIPLSYRSAVGESIPQFFDSVGDEWLRNMGGGMLVTCGLTYLGASCTDQGEKLGIHGRINNLPAEDISIQKIWNGDNCTLKLSGKVREAKMLSTNIVLEREIKVKLGEDKLAIRDLVRNEGFEKTPHMILYHINPGHPLLDEGAKFVANSENIQPRDDIAEDYLKDYDSYEAPTPDYPDIVFYHQLKEDETGWCQAGIVNRVINKGLYVSYERKNLPNFIQWKFTGEGNYVAGLEPANCHVDGRDKERKRGTLIFLEPGEEKEYRLEIGVLKNKKDVNKFNTVTHN